MKVVLGGARGRVRSSMGAFARHRPQWQVERMAVVHGVSWWYAQELWRFFLQVDPRNFTQPYAGVSNGRRRHASLVARSYSSRLPSTILPHIRAITDLTSLIIPIRAYYCHWQGQASRHAIVSEQQVSK